MHTEMSCTAGEDDWGVEQHLDQMRDEQRVAEVFERLNLVVTAVETHFSMNMDGTRDDLRWLESFVNRSK